MKPAVLAVTVAALTVPVWFAAPAHASNDVHIRVDPRDWIFSGSISIYSVACDDRGCEKSDIAKIQDFNVGPGVPMQTILDWTWDTLDPVYIVELGDVTLTGGGSTLHPDSIDVQISDHLVGEMSVIDPPVTPDSVHYNFGKPGGEYELKFYPTADVPSAQNVVRATDVTVSSVPEIVVTATPSKDAAVASARAKSDTAYVTDQPGRVTAMAKRFVDAPGSLINIHGYGPDRDVALTRADHVRDHLLTEITRLGGNPDEYPVMVTYAGDPDHKKNAHVTIHQHAASSITVPEGGALPIGGSS